MEQENNLQLELFSQANGETRAKCYADASFFKLIKAYEKTILIIIAIALTGIISFTLGVEKGKKIQAPLQARYETPLKRPAAAGAPVKETKIITPPLSKPENIGDGYTIQLASYRTKTCAQREAQELKNKGLTPMIVPKKDLMVLYVGNFPDKQKAQPLLSELKKRYQDCYIIKRRL